MKCKVCSLLYLFTLFICSSISAQINNVITDADKTSLEGIIVEKYHTADIKDAANAGFPKGAVTYRIYVDMKPGYDLQAVFGVAGHKLNISTTTKFYNNIKEGWGTGDKINDKKINEENLAFDSWLTIGAATQADNGIQLSEDKDGSILNSSSLEKADGLVAGKIKPITFFGIDPSFFNSNSSPSSFTTDNGSWAVFGGVKGVGESNKVLIAQLTTEGKLSFELNVQIGTPKGASVQFVAKEGTENEINFAGLSYKN